MTRREKARRERVAEALWDELAVGFDLAQPWARLRRLRHREYRAVRAKWLRAAEIALRAAGVLP